MLLAFTRLDVIRMANDADIIPKMSPAKCFMGRSCLSIFYFIVCHITARAFDPHRSASQPRSASKGLVGTHFSTSRPSGCVCSYPAKMRNIQVFWAIGFPFASNFSFDSLSITIIRTMIASSTRPILNRLR